MFWLDYTVPTEPFEHPGLEEMRQVALAQGTGSMRLTAPDWCDETEEEHIEKLRTMYTDIGCVVTISEVDGEPFIRVDPPIGGYSG